MRPQNPHPFSRMMKKILSIIVPVFNEEDNIGYVYKRLRAMLSTIPKYDYEIIFVDNRSRDQSVDLIKEICRKDKKATAIIMSRNFTSEYSSLAAMRQATGDILTVVDCDLQDPPEIIPKFIKEWEKGAQIVVGIRNVINDTVIMTVIRKSFYKIFKKMANIDMPLNAGSFCLLDRKVLDVINNLPERNRFFRGLRAWVGFRVVEVEYERKSRRYGESKNTIWDYLEDSQRGLLGFSFVPLDIMTTIGFILVILSFIFIVAYLYIVIAFGNPIQASIPLMLAIVFFGGMQMLFISIVGKYIQIIFEEVKGRPTYIIDEIINNHRK